MSFEYIDLGDVMNQSKKILEELNKRFESAMNAPLGSKEEREETTQFISYANGISGNIGDYARASIFEEAARRARKNSVLREETSAEFVRASGFLSSRQRTRMLTNAVEDSLFTHNDGALHEKYAQALIENANRFWTKGNRIEAHKEAAYRCMHPERQMQSSAKFFEHVNSLRCPSERYSILKKAQDSAHGWANNIASAAEKMGDEQARVSGKPADKFLGFSNQLQAEIKKIEEQYPGVTPKIPAWKQVLRFPGEMLSLMRVVPR